MPTKPFSSSAVIAIGLPAALYFRALSKNCLINSVISSGSPSTVGIRALNLNAEWDATTPVAPSSIAA